MKAMISPTPEQIARAKAAALEAVDQQQATMTFKVVAMSLLAMYNVMDATPEELNDVLRNMKSQVMPAYSEYQKDGVEDAALEDTLHRVGVQPELLLSLFED